MVFQSFAYCQCGAITLYAENDIRYSCKAENLRKFFPTLDLRKMDEEQETIMCDHCINNYGLDLCGCGSGKEYGKCDNGYDSCHMPYQQFFGTAIEKEMINSDEND